MRFLAIRAFIRHKSNPVIAISMAALLGASAWNVVIIIGVLSWTGVCRIVRAQMLSLRTREFIEAARALWLKIVSGREAMELAGETLRLCGMEEVPHALRPCQTALRRSRARA